jgi:hypothetical protein
MYEAWQVIRTAMRLAWADLFSTIVVNLLWLLANLLIIPGPPATLALFYVGNRMAHEEIIDPKDFLSALHRNFGLGWQWGLLNLFVFFFLIGDVILTNHLSQSNLVYFFQGMYMTLAIIWLLWQLYTLPFLFEQEKPYLRLALRNGAIMLGKNIGFSLWLAVFLVTALAMGTVFFFVVFAAGAVWVALVGNHAVLNRLSQYSSSASK